MATAVVAVIALLRLAELLWARRNTRRLLARGAVEIGRGHYPLFILLHGLWLLAITLAVPETQMADPVLLAIFGVLQVARVWVIVSLGPFWTTRIITLPGAPLVRRGPYRLLRHPNYLLVACEIAILPLAFGAWEIALVFSIANTALLLWRVKIEEQALASRRSAQRSWKEDVSAT